MFKSSATEVGREVHVTVDQKYIDPGTFNKIYDQAGKVSRLNSDLTSYVLQNQKQHKKPRKRSKPTGATDEGLNVR